MSRFLSVYYVWDLKRLCRLKIKKNFLVSALHPMSRYVINVIWLFFVFILLQTKSRIR